MPHRTTYIFPRQFPERVGLDESSKQKQLLDHEKKKIVNSIKHDTFTAESDPPQKSSLPTPTKDNNDVVLSISGGKHSAVSDLFAAGEKFRTKHKQIAAFCDWLIDKKASSHSSHYHLHDLDLLLPPETTAKDAAVDQSFDRQVSLPRLSSGSSYAGSLFSGTTTLDCNFSSDIKEETTTSRTLITIPAPRHKDEEEEEHGTEKLAKKSKESYILQLTLAKRLTCLASLVTEPVLTPGTETWDAESVSYRLWVQNSPHC